MENQCWHQLWVLSPAWILHPHNSPTTAKLPSPIDTGKHIPYFIKYPTNTPVLLILLGSCSSQDWLGCVVTVLSRDSQVFWDSLGLGLVAKQSLVFKALTCSFFPALNLDYWSIWGLCGEFTKTTWNYLVLCRLKQNRWRIFMPLNCNTLFYINYWSFFQKE